ncbi:FtsK/SpoIIIE domain-containing protein [Demequina silvatica]|uniref:FtsK/SpoIIIE domain-containing protein n=1 Tax=Demequina silvatica TaxID=1638988 RepID=UPI000781AE35|nr:FtsK/SpoIIIE domain-containing protein [Demequina silvatica]
MILTIEGAGDVEAAPGTPLGAVLAAAGAPAAVWCGSVRLDADHRVGAPPLLAAARLTVSPGRAAAPRAGPHARVIAGPDAGGALAPMDRDAVVGRDGASALEDPALSRRHLAIDARGRARDLGSRNGTVLVRGGRRRRLGRLRRRLRDGDVLFAGGSAVRWVGDDARAGESSPVASGPGAGGSTRIAPLLAGVGGAAAGAAAIGAATGRWAIAAAMLAAPLAWALVALARRRRSERTPELGLEELAAVPLPVAVVGEADVALGVARAIAVAREVGLEGLTHEPWTRWHERRLPAEAVRVVARDGSPSSEARTVIDADAATLTVEGRTRAWHVAAVSATTADALARAAVGGREPGLPDLLRWGDLPPPERPMTAALGVDRRGPVMLDLDADGPHVLVAGTTGSGKSALLETVVAGLAHAHPPERLGVALVDLKGGAGLGACAALPHARGLLTDLEPGSARRMLLGLAHELRERKRALAREALPSWVAWEQRGAASARLLVVVDEFQELGALDPGLLSELARLAAQGRSLGVHLLLATQRPAGAVSPAIRANVGTVIALRTATAAESHDLLGDASAAELPGSAPGRAILASPRGRTTLQAALPVADPTPPVRPVGHAPPPGRALADTARERWDARPRPEPLWLPALAEEASAPPGAFGWIDLPETRTRAPLVWDPADGPLLVVGPRGSGRTTTLDAVAAALPGTVCLPADPREAVRTLALAAAARPAALVVDDADVATARLEPLLRGSPQALEDLARVVPLVIACGPGWGARWAARAGARVVLSGLDRIEQQLWGVPPALAGLDAAPGRGVAVTPRASGECRIVPAPCPPPRTLVAPLICGADLPAGAVGVVGDDARPLRLPRDGVAVIGAPGAARDALVASLAAAGVRAEAATVTPSGAPIELLADPTPARLRELGILAPPGLAEPAPPPGRVMVRRGSTWEAAQLRMPPEPRTEASAVA